MSGACLLAGVLTLQLATGQFELAWQHSVEKTDWREFWRVEADGLRLVKAAVKGSGAGMEPGDGARLVDGWWVWEPDTPLLERLTLAVSGATGSGWRICSDGICHEIGVAPGQPLTVAPCAP